MSFASVYARWSDPRMSGTTFMRTRNTLVTTALLAGLLALATPAAAYVRTTTTTGVPTAWKTPCVTMEFSLGAPPLELDAAGYLSAAQTAGAAWSQASLDGVQQCSNVIFTVVPVADDAGPVGMDYTNRLIFRQGECPACSGAWCSDPLPKDGSCYDRNALAITSVFQIKSTGEIVDADLEVNATTWTWGDYVGHPEQFESTTHDFQGTITHEFGHVIGLDHTCYTPGTRADGTPIPRPVDNNGNPVPDCGADNSPSITQATMYPSVTTPSAEVELRSLSPDDVQGACEIYPFTPNFVCLPPSRSDSGSGSGGCSYAAQPGPGAIASVLMLFAMAMVVRRRR